MTKENDYYRECRKCKNRLELVANGNTMLIGVFELVSFRALKCSNDKCDNVEVEYPKRPQFNTDESSSESVRVLIRDFIGNYTN